MSRTGGDIMVHGTCSSRGCFAMTNDQMEEIYAIMRESFAGGQKAVQFQSFPFRMTAENLAKFRHDPNMNFWKNLKEGNDHFEVTKREPQVAYCGQKYIFNTSAEGGRPDPVAPCPKLRVDETLAQAVAAKQAQDEKKVAELIERGTPAISVRYADGSQHDHFRESSSFVALAGDRIVQPQPNRAAKLGEISRPEAIGAVEVVHLDPQGAPKKAAPASTASISKPADAAGTAVASAASSAAPAAQANTSGAAAPSAGLTMFSGIGSLFSAKKEAVTPAAPQQAATNTAPEKPLLQRWFGSDETTTPPAAFPSTVPLPPRRAAAEQKQRVSDVATPRAVMKGAQPIVTADLVAPQ